jgi:hypothetical protein
LDEVDDRARGHWIGEIVAIAKLRAIDKDGHVVAEPALIVEDVAASLFVDAEVPVQEIAHGGARDFKRRARDVALDVLSESDGGHRSSELHEDFQTIERRVPLGRNTVEATAGGIERGWLELPNAFAPETRAACKAGVSENVEMFGDGLARDAPMGHGSLTGEVRDRHGSRGREARHNAKTSFVAKSGENWRGSLGAQSRGARPFG